MSLGLLLAFSVVVGAAAGMAGALTPVAAFSAAVAAASSGGLPQPRWGQVVWLLLAAGLASAGHAAGARQMALSPPLGQWFAASSSSATPVPVLLSGWLRDDAAAARGGGVRLVVHVNQVRYRGVQTTVAGLVQLHVAGDLGDKAMGSWTRGRRVEAPVALRWPAYIRNPGSPSIEWQTLSRDVVLLGGIKSAALVDVAPGRWWDEWGAAVRRFVRQGARAVMPGHPQAEAILVAILIGDRSGLAPELEERLLQAGTYHVVAISGGNVALVTMLSVGLLRLVTRSAPSASLSAIGVVAVYGWIVGADPSVTRAVTAAIVWLAASAAGLAAAPLHVLATVAVAVTIADPHIVIEPGAWLSFGATFGILVFAEPCSRLLVARVSHGPPGRLRSVWAGAVGIVAATLAVEIVLLPVGLFVFSRMSLAGPFMNVLAIPAMAVAQLAGMCGIGLHAVWPVAASGAGWLAGLAIDVITESPRALNAVPWVAWRAAPPAWPWAIGFYLATTTAVLSSSPRLRRWAVGAVVLALAGLCLAPSRAVSPPRPGWLRITAFDVGQGEALLVQFPRGKALLIDAGNATDTFDVGERVVTPALWASGVTRLDWAALSHADRDHAGGLLAVADTFRPREIWEGVPVPPDATRRSLVNAAAVAGRVWRELRRGDRVAVDDVVVEVLHPEMPDWERQRVRNDDSVVLRLRYGDLEMLFTGDVSANVERTLAGLLDDPDRRLVRILKVAHHGSRSSTSDALLRAYRPWAAIVSAGRNNPFGHPALDVLRRLEGAEVPLFRTDRDGAVSVETDGQEVRLSTWAGRVWRTVVVPARRPS